MAKSNQTSSTLRTVAMFGAAVLVAAAALVYLNGSAGPDTSELATLSQSLPSQARAALVGEDGAYDRLARDQQRLSSLRRQLASVVEGRESDWQALESGLQSLTANRQVLESAALASVELGEAAAESRVIADQLLDRSGATSIIEDSARRLDVINRTAPALLLKENAADLAVFLGSEVAFLRDVVNGLSGESSPLDIRPLNDAGREQIVAPLDELVATMESATAALTADPEAIAGAAPAQKQAEGAAMRLLETGVGQSSAGGLPGFLARPWLPLVLIASAVLLIVAMVFLSNKLASFETVAAEQADQNERNQQAILRLLDEMGSLADGDLTVEATVTEDITGTIADSFNFAIEELRKLVTTVNETAIMVDTASKQTESTASHMARAAETQTREINAATESIVSMAASIEEVSGNAERSSDVARHSVDVAHKGGEAVRRTIDGMNTIRETIQDTSKRIKRLGESSQEIGNIVELINDIAEQTNILALNASIQASMAGEAGRGFAVVADEVQRLAERSTNATKQIEVLVSTIQADTKEAVVSMERSTTDVVGGALLAENAGAALDEIEQVSNQIASLVQNISGSARQQASSAADVTRRTTRLREISEQTGKATTATAAAISKLSEFASQLRKSVAGFTLPEDVSLGNTLVTKSTSDPAPAGTTDRPAANSPEATQAKAG
jgi:twitching motility protein PilJ